MTNIEFTLLCAGFVKSLVLEPIWFYYSISVWVGFSNECFEGLVILDFVNMLLLWVKIFMFAFLACCCCPLIFCAPQAITYQRDRIRVQYDPNFVPEFGGFLNPNF